LSQIGEETVMDRRDFTKAAALGVVALAAPTVRSSNAVAASNVESIPVVLECGINGSTTKDKNPLAPETVMEHIAEINKCIEAGATIVHNHAPNGSPDPQKAAQFYLEVFGPLRQMHPEAIMYATVNFDAAEFHRTRTSWPNALQCQHQRILAESGLANMVLFETGVSAAALFDTDGAPKSESFFVYQFWPEDIRYTRKVCEEFGTGASFSIYEPGWLKNILAMAKAGTLPRGSKLNLYFGGDEYPAMAPPIPEALELYLAMMEGYDLNWGVACPARDGSIMDTPVARLALERGGGLRVGLEDDTTGPANTEQIKRAYQLAAEVGREVITGAAAIDFLDIPYPQTRL
jgi:uncharacterized protein (DUF849 family)